MKKRIFAIVMTLALILSMSAFAVSAESQPKFIGVDADGNETPGNDFAAVASGSAYVRLMTGEAITLTADTVVDVNNQTVTINTKGHKLGLLDSNSTVSASAVSKVTVSASRDLNRITAMPGTADQYVAVHNADGTYTPRWVYVKLTTASLRPTDTGVGIYYKSAVKADPAMKDSIKYYGIAASLGQIPEDFRDSVGVGYTQQSYTASETGNIDFTAVSGIISDIIEKGRVTPSVDVCGKMPINAISYVTVQLGGEDYDVLSVSKAQKSLYDLMEKLNTQYESNPVPENIKNLVSAWEAPMNGWNLYNLISREEYLVRHCICGCKDGEHLPGCDGTVQDWTAWNTNTAMPAASGYYYLNTNVSVSATNNLTNAHDIFIDLNGHSVNSTADRIYILNNSKSNLTLLDTDGTGKVTMKSSAGGALVHLANDFAKTLTIYGGTYDASAVKVTTGRSGAMISTAGTGTAAVNIHGGTLIGGSTTGDYVGGTIYLGSSGSSLTMTDGVISGGKTAKGGGNVAVDGATMTMSGGIIADGVGTSGTLGGNVYAYNSAKVAFTGGVIECGTADGGGNVLVNGATVTMSGGAIRGGTASNGGNVRIQSTGGSFTMTGGEVYGGVTQGTNPRGGNFFNSTNGTLNISGTAKVYDGVGKTDENGDGNIYTLAAAAGTTVEKPENIYYTTHCVCGSTGDTHLADCDGTAYQWTPWFKADTLPNTTGYYYLAKDVTLDTTLVITTAQEICLDLNGHTVNASTRVYQMAAANIKDSLTILDSVGGGKVVMTTYAGGGTFAAIGNTGSKTVTIYGGTFDASAINCGGNNGAFFRVGSATSKLNIHGGEIIGGKANGGGVVHINAGNVTMTGGTVRGGSAGNGGNIVVASGGSFTMTGGRMYGGKATAANGRGGNIFNNASVVSISGSALVYDGTAAGDGANIYSLDNYTTDVDWGCVYLTRGDGDGIYPALPPFVENHCICGSKNGEHLPGCDGTVQSWTAWNTADAMPKTAGYYYLNTDVTVSATNNLDSKRDIFIDLNGHTVTSTANRLYILNNSNTTLTLLDTVGTGKIVMTGTGGGALAHLANANAKTLTIYSGTYDASGVTVSADRSGNVISTVSNTGTAKVNIHGGTVIGGSASDKYGAGTMYIVSGGAVLTMTGGEIRGGSTAGNGGSVYLDTNATANISGGILTGGSASNGGNVYIKNGAALTVTGGKICDGTASNGGGNIMATGGAVLTVTGGEICGGKATATGTPAGRGGNIFNSDSTVTVSADAKVYDGTAAGDGTNIFSTGDYTTTAEPGCVYFTEKSGNGIYPADFDIENHCICGVKDGDHLPGCDGTIQLWTAWDTADAMPDTAGYYYLNTDVETSATNNLTTARDIFIDLNGHTVTSSANRLYILNESNTTLTLLDTVGTGKIVMTGTNGGALVHLANANNKVLTIYGGTYDASGVTVSGGRSGGVISTVSNTGTAKVNIHGGTIIGGSTTGTYLGGAIYLTTAGVTMNMTGGEIIGGKSAASGGNLFIDSGTVMTMSGGTVRDGSAANGGNVYLSGSGTTLNMSGGTITGGTATSMGGNVYVYSGAKFNMTGGSVDGGLSEGGGNLVANGGAVTMSGGEIWAGTASNGGNVRIQNSGGSFAMTGGEAYGGTAQGSNPRGGNFFVSAATLNISGTAKVYDGVGKTDSLGDGNIYTLATATTTVEHPENIYYLPTRTLEVGYGKACITPEQTEGIILTGGASTGKLDDIYVITTAFRDEEGNVYLHVVTDLTWGGMADTYSESSTGVCDMARTLLKNELGISPEFVTVGGIHNHSQVDYSSDNELNVAWRENILKPQIVASAQAAISDLAPAEMYIGRAQTSGLNFVRRYWLSDGSFYDAYTSNRDSEIVAHETDPDEEVQMVRFTRDDKKDILMINWQCHATKVSSTGTKICADFVGPLRDKVEQELDVQCVFYQGAAGNLTPTSRMAGETQIADGWKGAQKVGQAVADVVINAFGSGVFEKVNTGLIQSKRITVTGTVKKFAEVGDELYNNALKVVEFAKTASHNYEIAAYAKQFGIETIYHANTIIQNAKAASHKTYEINVISIGDVAFATLPMEFFDTTGMQIKRGSPFRMTVLLGYSCGKGKYSADLNAISHGGYETYNTYFADGTAEEALGYYLKSLRELYPTRSGSVHDDGILKVLMVGNSFCNYFTDELYGMLTAAGKPAVIANVYFSGCSLYRHVRDYKENIYEFEFYVTDGNGRRKETNVGLAHCLDADDWDVISIQNHFYPNLTADYAGALEVSTTNAPELVKIIRSHKPAARLLWHETWAFQVGYDRNDGQIATVEAQTEQYEAIRDISHAVADSLHLPIVPSGDAWQIARANPFVGDTLCVDSTRNEGLGDNYHDGNVGGGQYLNACVWFEALTGQSPAGNTYVPEYTLSQELMAALQTAAHAAFATEEPQ